MEKHQSWPEAGLLVTCQFIKQFTETEPKCSLTKYVYYKALRLLKTLTTYW